MKLLSTNSVLQSSHKGGKTAPKVGRLAAKAVGVKPNKHNGNRHLPAPLGQNRSPDSPRTRMSRSPRMGLPTKGQVLLPKTPSTYVGRLSFVSDWHRQVGKIYREMRRGQLEASLGTKLTFVCNIGATLAKFVAETAPKGDIGPTWNLDRLTSAELEEFERLMAKANGQQPQQRIELGAADDT